MAYVNQMMMTSLECSDIGRFYAGRSVFITGATGFIGKVLVHKLLRSCPDISKIYILMRPSKGKNVNSRLTELIQNQVFDPVRSTTNKLVAVEGDVTMPQFGMSCHDLQLVIDDVSVVFHSAATVRFNEKLKAAVEMNVLGVRRMLEICRQMKHLVAMVHVSTAYCNVDREDNINEVIYPIDYDPIKLIELLTTLPNQLIDAWTKDLLGHFPNTYTFTKKMAEKMLEMEAGDLPLVIVRPSIVTAAVKEPFPGWIDNYNGPTGIMAGVGKGVVRALKGDVSAISDFIPVDMTVNLMIAAGLAVASNKPEGRVQVFHSATGSRNPLTWGDFTKEVIKSWSQIKSNSSRIRRPDSTMHAKDLHYVIHRSLAHSFIGHVMDIPALLSGNHQKWTRLYKKINRSVRTLEFFTTHEWRFVSTNVDLLWDSMSDRDRTIFYFNVRSINWQNYVNSYVTGIQRFLLKEDDASASSKPIRKK